MRKAIAKTLRHTAEEKTVGQSVFNTRRLYRKLKKGWKENMRNKVEPKLKISKRQERVLSA